MAVIVIHLRRATQTKNESRSFLKNVLHLCIEGVATDDLFVGFKEGAVLRIESVDHQLAALGISLPEHPQNVPFQELTECFAHKSLHIHTPKRYALDCCGLASSS